MLGGRRGSEVDGEGTVSGSAVYADTFAAEAGTDSGGAFLSSDFIVQGWGAGCRPDSAGTVVTSVVNVFENRNVPYLS